MKKLILAILLLVSTSFVSAQNTVDIRLTSLTSTNCQITLYPSFSETSVLSNVVFTLRWRSNRNIAISNPPINNQIPIARSGPVRTSGSWKYQVYSGVGLQTGLISQPIIINIPRSGSGEITIAVDSYVEQTSVNGKFYVSVGGQNVTGAVLVPKSLTSEEPTVNTLFYNPSDNLFYLLVDNQYYTLMGQRVILNDTTNLIAVHKKELE